MDVAAHLTGLAARKATGRLEVTGPAGAAHLIVHDARICSVQLSSGHPALAKRLVSTGRLTLVGFGAAVRMQQEHPQVSLGEALVRMGLVTGQDLEAAEHEQIRDDVATVLGWHAPEMAFVTVSTGTTPPLGVPIDEALSSATARAEQWQQIEQMIGGLQAVPAPGDPPTSGQALSLQPAGWAVLCRVDGQRTLGTIAGQTGLTALEVGEVVLELVSAGLATVPAPRGLTVNAPAPTARIIHLAEPPTIAEPTPPAAPAQTPPPKIAAPMPPAAPAPTPPAAPAQTPAPAPALTPPAVAVPAPAAAAPPSVPAAVEEAASGHAAGQTPDESEAVADPSDLLRELSQLARGSDPITNPRASR